MLTKVADIKNRLAPAFDERQAELLAEVVVEAYEGLVKSGDFNELKEIVRELAQAQQGLAQAQQRTEQRVEELAQAQQRTEQWVGELAQAQQELAQEMRVLAIGLNDTRAELGGLGRSVGYALENEAYRALPAFLKTHHGLELTERLIRTEIGGEEINVFGRALREGKTVLIVGETKLRLDERRTARRGEKDVFETLERKVTAVQAAHPAETIIPLLVTHYARAGFLHQAQARGIIVVQSFEW